MPETSMSLAIQMKITLAGIQPPVWRRVLVPSVFDLTKLHRIIQEAFGWEGYHHHTFRIRGEAYGPEDDSGWDSPKSENIKLARLFLDPGETFTYEYDFGDSWIHEIAVEDVCVLDGPLGIPLCLEGKRACPPEDSGGSIGFPDLLRASRDPKHPDHEIALEFFEPGWDPEAFSLKAVNTCLRMAFEPKPKRVRKPKVKA